MIINVLGNTSNIDEIKKFANKKKIYLIEDNCESLGSKYKNKYLGSFGDFSSFSFYYSHQVTSGEGGMIACKTKEDYLLLKTLRAHGWDRDIQKQRVNKKFNFINSGFNLRPLEISAAIGLNQFKRLSKMMSIRTYNRNKIIYFIKKSKNWHKQFSFFYPHKNLKPSWFGLPLLINKDLIYKKEKFLKYLNNTGVETRPILSGNFLNQQGCKLYNFKYKKSDIKVSQEIEDRGFFIGLPTKKISKEKLNFLVKNLLKIDDLG